MSEQPPRDTLSTKELSTKWARERVDALEDAAKLDSNKEPELIEAEKTLKEVERLHTKLENLPGEVGRSLDMERLAWGRGERDDRKLLPAREAQRKKFLDRLDADLRIAKWNVKNQTDFLKSLEKQAKKGKGFEKRFLLAEAILRKAEGRVEEITNTIKRIENESANETAASPQNPENRVWLRNFFKDHYRRMGETLRVAPADLRNSMLRGVLQYEADAMRLFTNLENARSTQNLKGAQEQLRKIINDTNAFHEEAVRGYSQSPEPPSNEQELPVERMETELHAAEEEPRSLESNDASNGRARSEQTAQPQVTERQPASQEPDTVIPEQSDPTESEAPVHNPSQSEHEEAAAPASDSNESVEIADETGKRVAQEGMPQSVDVEGLIDQIEKGGNAVEIIVKEGDRLFDEWTRERQSVNLYFLESHKKLWQLRNEAVELAGRYARTKSAESLDALKSKLEEMREQAFIIEDQVLDAKEQLSKPSEKPDTAVEARDQLGSAVRELDKTRKWPSRILKAGIVTAGVAMLAGDGADVQTPSGKPTVEAASAPSKPEISMDIERSPTITPGKGADALFSELKTQLREQYGNNPPDVPAVRAVLDKDPHQFAQSFGFSDDTSSRIMTLGESLRIANNELVFHDINSGRDIVLIDRQGQIPVGTYEMIHVHMLPNALPRAAAPRTTRAVSEPRTPEVASQEPAPTTTPPLPVDTTPAPTTETPSQTLPVEGGAEASIPVEAPEPQPTVTAEPGPVATEAAETQSPTPPESAVEAPSQPPTPRPAPVERMMSTSIWSAAQTYPAINLVDSPAPSGTEAATFRQELFNLMREAGTGPKNEENIGTYIARAQEVIVNNKPRTMPVIVQTPDELLVAHGGDLSSRQLIAREYMRQYIATNPNINRQEFGIIVENEPGALSRGFVMTADTIGSQSENTVRYYQSVEEFTKVKKKDVPVVTGDMRIVF